MLSARAPHLWAASPTSAWSSILEPLYAHRATSSLARKAGFRTRSNRSPADLLTPREFEVLGLIAAGMRNGEIARALFISQSTAKVHVRHVLEKLGVRTRAEAVARLKMFGSRLKSGGRDNRVGRRTAVIGGWLTKSKRCPLGQPVALVCPCEDRLKGSHYGRVKLRLDRLCEPKASNTAWHGVAIRPIRGHRVVGIGYGNDPRKLEECQVRPVHPDTPGRQLSRGGGAPPRQSLNTCRRWRGSVLRFRSDAAFLGAHPV